MHQLTRYSDSDIVDLNTFNSCAKTVYKVSEAWVQDEPYQKVRMRKLSWKHKSAEIMKELEEMFPMWAMEVGEGEDIRRFLDCRDLRLAWQ